MSSPTTRSGGYIPPGSFMRRVANPLVRALGGPVLIVRGRISGHPIGTPVAPFDYAGDRYLIARRGETQWVRNLRIAGRCELRLRWRHVPFHATELRGDEHQLVVGAYLKRLGRRADAFLAELPNPADHPIFRLDPIGPPIHG
ncbi:nitroreductase/quinone reductase family protein [Cryobacterium arcticum]|uniref:Deazaflavin-dependent nitroreductase n=1 Tax=Cryobacterium arcticum TaxID=670052 RepID=A0A317ZP07_9MICO|nr:nitroreductase/quinone reductase family protein [Cryobacterium arcticum]PXA68211.1 deazaflavin-dependent nitroreductase [Cryobacterium arcticum]